MKTRFRRILHRLVFTGLALATLLALFYAEENWRGAHVRAATERELAAHGERFQAKDFIPPFVPDRENLAMAPLFARAFQYQLDHRTGLVTFGSSEQAANNPTRQELDNALYGLGNQSGAHSPRPGANWSAGYRRNLAGWQDYYRQRKDFPHALAPQSPAADILLAQTRYADVFDELARAADERPLIRFPVNWTQRPPTGIALPHCNTIQKLVSALSLRASAHLAAGQTADARREVELAFRLTQSLRNEPILISYLVQTTCLGILTQPLWEGLEARQWSAVDLTVLGSLLRDCNILGVYQHSLRGERTLFVNQTLDDLRTAAGQTEFFRSMGNYQTIDSRRMEWILRLSPRGWLDLNVALGDRLLQHGIEAVDPVQGRVWLGRLQSFIALTSDASDWRPNTFAIRSLLPVYHSLLVKAAQTQAALNQAVTACALERYFLDHHAYPAALSELVPTYLDRVLPDPIDGAPLHYRLTADGRFQLYSVGPDEKDDGGTIEWPPNRPVRNVTNADGKESRPYVLMPDKTKADWVWQYAPAEPPAPPNNRSRLESRP